MVKTGRKTGAAIFVFGVMLAATAAWAGHDGGHGRMGDGAGMMFKELDTNKDGVISQQEFEARAATKLKGADSSKDGFVNFDEYRAYALKEMEQRHQEMMKRRFDRIDANKDGKVSAEEMKAASDRMFTRMDMNKDGKIDKTDHEEMKKRMGGGHMWRGPQGGGPESDGDEPN